ncbi:hypothetical protein ACWGJ2_19290 [Streptomyces sp. NPDC054796]
MTAPSGARASTPTTTSDRLWTAEAAGVAGEAAVRPRGSGSPSGSPVGTSAIGHVACVSEASAVEPSSSPGKPSTPRVVVLADTGAGDGVPPSQRQGEGRTVAATPVSPAERGTAGGGAAEPLPSAHHPDTGGGAPDRTVPYTSAAARRWALVAATKDADTVVAARRRGRRPASPYGARSGRKTLDVLLRISHCPVTVVPVFDGPAGDGAGVG